MIITYQGSKSDNLKFEPELNTVIHCFLLDEQKGNFNKKNFMRWAGRILCRVGTPRALLLGRIAHPTIYQVSLSVLKIYFLKTNRPIRVIDC